MELRKRTYIDYDTCLWELVWKRACDKPGGQIWSKRAIVEQLSIDTGVAVATVWRCFNREKPWRKDVRNKLLAYAGFADIDALKAFVDEEEKKRGDAYQYIKEVIGDNETLKRIYLSLKASPLLNPGGGEQGLEPIQTGNLFLLIKAILGVYTTESSFTSLSLVADKSGSFGKLSMKDYFIQLSYVTQTELKTRESLVRNETELNKIKLRRALETNQKLTKDYVINFNLQNVQNLLILGSPGIGKSTFGRWLCHTWAENVHTIENTILVYVQLKSLEFKIGQNPIITYLRRNYLTGNAPNNEDLHDVLRKAASTICFILDGYDELSEKQKESLYHRLQEISSNCRYILTSRPYGIIDTYGLKWDQVVQLDGLDTSNINNYIDAFLRHRRTIGGQTREKLIELINLNPTLVDFAHNPLMLSFMVYVYLSDGNAHETFEKIQTRFDLQEVVVNWIFAHNRIKHSIRLDAGLINKAADIACEMELEKKSEKNSFLKGETEEIFVPLSRLGLAQYIEHDIGSHSFYFSSITFQEYFASIAIVRQINSGGI